MGIIRRQGTKHTIIQYLGVAIGAVSTLFIYPLNQELYGFAQFLIGTSLLLYPLCNLGLNTVLLKYFPRFSNEEDRGHTFFRWIILLSLCVFFAVGALLLLFKAKVIALLNTYGFAESHLLAEYYTEILILVGLTIVIVVLRAQALNYKRIVVPHLISEFSLKLFLPVTILISLYFAFHFDNMARWMIYYNIAIICLLIGYLSRIGAVSMKPSTAFTFGSSFLNRDVLSYSAFSSLNRMGTLLAFRIDAFMITLILGAASNGLYYVILFIANVIQVPFKSINQISVPLISRAWEENDVDRINRIYQQSARTLMLLSLIIFLFLYWSLPDILMLSPKSDQLQAGVGIFLFLGLARLVESVTSVNEPILNYSRYYHYGLVFIIILGVSNIVLNYHLIQLYGLVGAAMATLISYSLYNLIKLIFLYFRFGLQPFSIQVFYILMLGLVAYAIHLPVETFDSPVIRVILNGLILAVSILIPSIVFRLSPEFNGLLIIASGKLPIFGKSLQSWLKKYE